MSKLCPVCGSAIEDVASMNSRQFRCTLCGEFILSSILVTFLPKTLINNKDGSNKISHAIRTMQQNNVVPEINPHTVDEILKRPLPTPREQADLFIRWLAENIEGPGETVLITPATHRSIIGAKTDEGFGLVLKHLFKADLVNGYLNDDAMSEPITADITLSFDGWNYYEELCRGGATYKKGFIAMKFGDPLLDQLLAEILKPCAKQAGFELLRLDDTPKAGLIDDRLRVEIQSSDFLVADLTHDNPGAYWEAGYAEGLGKPVIYICEKDKFDTTKTHFDTNHHLTIMWDKDNLPKAGQELKATIRATLPHLAKQENDIA